METTIVDLVNKNILERPDKLWLTDFATGRSWSWLAAYNEICAVSGWLERELGCDGASVALLSNNRAHWVLADLAVISSGNTTIPLFTSSSEETVSYILNFSEVKVLILGDVANWSAVCENLDPAIAIITLPDVDIDPAQKSIRTVITWEAILNTVQYELLKYRGTSSSIVSIIFTSGTTGLPKGVLQTHESMICPMLRHANLYSCRENPKFLSYLPLAHIAERQLVLIQSLIQGAEIYFNESLPYLVRDMAICKPNFFFGAPRVWEQIKQGILSRFESQEALDHAVKASGESVADEIKRMIGLQDADLLAVGSAPMPSSLVDWFSQLDINILEGYGQTEAMGISGNTKAHSKVGSIGRPYPGVEMLIDDTGELLCKADGLALGYYKDLDNTSKTFVNGWVHTGDTATVDDDGFYFITGRIKDYFKTIHGKFVSPLPIENAFLASNVGEQVCLLGRGYSKTIIVCVLADAFGARGKSVIESELLKVVSSINKDVDKHSRIGGVIVSKEKWSMDNAILTPTLKIRRDRVESIYGDKAEVLARVSAEDREIRVLWE